MTKARNLADNALTTVSPTELGYLDGVTSAVQTQINTKAASTTPTLTGPIIISPEERTTISATAATGTVNFDASTQGVLYYTTNASGNWTLNVRASSSATLNSILVIGDAITVSFLVTNGSTAYYQTAFTIDGSAVTPKYSGGTAPASGNTSSIDVYTFTIVKTANATFTVFGAGPIKYA
jgi:VCBS repeat-containing protein